MVKPHKQKSISVGQNRFDIEGNSSAWNLINKLIENPQDLKWNNAVVGDNSGTNQENQMRKSQVSWLKSNELKKELWEIINTYNHEISGWKYDIQAVEDIQYTVYVDGGHYDWHIDCGLSNEDLGVESEENFDRKISVSIFLNDPDEYEGGELDVETKGPLDDPRYDTFKLPKGSMIVFPSSTYHRVRPVTSGIRKALVVWFIGPSFR